ncbi:Legume-like lectin family protein [Histomonas meleagridis]|uniref:Legume-like lectin family protein n=1 Tax=Histomonas meleagridis TaxID=135588 RepID=UPI003559FC12|nr:Legume-like lectin family protein [Histomonas meleagridis]KAH0800251.1 Legume-like lectin family protein [Histomonas meleagridis]
MGTFLFLCFSLEGSFDIFPPITLSNSNELGFWSLVGVATNLKSSIHFASDYKKQNSGICQRLPTTSNDWLSEFRAEVSKGSLSFIISDNFCPYYIHTNATSFNQISFNITRIDNMKLKIAFHYLNDDNQIHRNLCQVYSQNVTVRITYKDNTITCYALDDRGSDFTQCGDPIEATIPNANYFSFFAESQEGIGESELFHFLTRIPPNHTEKFNKTEMDDANRRKLRKLLKPISHPVLPLAERIINEMEKASYKLDQSGKNNYSGQEIRDLLLEIRSRLKDSLTTKDLQRLVHATLTVSLMRTEHKMEKRSRSFTEIQDDLKNLKNIVKDKMDSISQCAMDALSNSKNDSINTLMSFYNRIKDYDNLTDEAKSRSKEMKSSFVPTFLYMISFIELACYVAFFFVKRKKTLNFKKHE